MFILFLFFKQEHIYNLDPTGRYFGVHPVTWYLRHQYAILRHVSRGTNHVDKLDFCALFRSVT